VRRLLSTIVALAVGIGIALAAEPAKKDTPAAAKTRKKLKEKISVDYKDTRLRDVALDLQKQLDNRIVIKLDNDGGVSNNLTVTYSAKEKPVDVILDEMFAKNQLGYVVVSDGRDRRDGFIIIKKGKQRGYETGEEPAKTTEKPAKDKDKPEGDKPPKDGEKPKDKPAKDKPKKDSARDGGKPKDKPARDGGDDPDKAEKLAAAKLNLAKMLHKDGLIQKAKQRYDDIIKQFPNTKAAEEARTLLKKLEK
jgi:hypothetical protein